MAVYEYYTDICARCGKEYPKRHLNKISYTKSHEIYGSPRQLCGLCDPCFTAWLDEMEISEPGPSEHRYLRRRWCRKCCRDVGKTAEYCPYCGEKV